MKKLLSSVERNIKNTYAIMTCKGIRHSWWLVPLQHYTAVSSILEHSLQERVCTHKTREVNKLHKSGENWTYKICEGPFPKWQLQKTLLGQDAEQRSCWRRLLWPAVCRRMSGPESIREHRVKQSKPGPLKRYCTFSAVRRERPEKRAESSRFAAFRSPMLGGLCSHASALGSSLLL